MNDYKIGQRWISEMEPELGLGIIKHVDERFILIHFPASDCERKFAVSGAPLKRVEFRVGDNVKSRSGLSFQVTLVNMHEGNIIYHGDNNKLSENELCDNISFSTPQDRLMNGFHDGNNNFYLRYQTLINRYNIKKSNIRGYIGARIDLIPHQIYVSHEISSRYIPRVLLSDETGLGKTIEACLVLHRLLLNERISRVLILVPDSLVHQWFIELLRRFNLVFRIFDKEYCESIQLTDHDANPFLEEQLGICNIDFLTSNPKWKNKAVEAGWDMLIIDEAHHLTIDSPAYNMANELNQVSIGLMLLTATPEQLGHLSHFSRLKLIDPARYHDFKVFEQEEKQYLNTTKTINKLLDGDDKLIIEKLLDQNGTGRAVFRNIRASIKGFPKRIAHLIPLIGNDEDLKFQTFEFYNTSKEITFNFMQDPRIKWLIQFLKKNKDEKVLLICKTIEKVLAIEEALKHHKIHVALFHEELTLLQRDKNASWFAQKSGAQILICSEIGSEGRNFQFSHHLILFDLPMNPELLEQRIGRLDRIGQEHDINIYVPYVTQSEYEIFARWYNEGIDAFKKNIPGIYELFQNSEEQIKKIALEKDFINLETFIKYTQKKCSVIAKTLKNGRDRLLELNSFNPKIANDLIDEIRKIDIERNLERFMINVFNMYGIRAELVSERSYKLNLSLLSSPEFPLSLQKKDDITVTFDRKTALLHEDIEFLTWDHPMVLGAMDLILGSEKGNCAIGVLPGDETKEILLEAIFVMECVASKNLHIDRFLPPKPLRVIVNNLFLDCNEKYPQDLIFKHIKNSLETNILENAQIKQKLLPAMIKKCNMIADENASTIISSGLNLMKTSLNKEVTRLVELKKVNKNIREEEILSCRQELKLLEKSILSARFRLDSLRLISKGELVQ